ncbi:MAG: EamA family transporter [Pseudonocardiaceae bacterium]
MLASTAPLLVAAIPLWVANWLRGPSGPRRGGAPAGGLRSVGWSAWGLVVVGELSNVEPGSVTVGSWLALGYLVLVDSLVGFVLYHWLLRSAPVALVSTYAYAVPLVAYFVGVVVLGEPFHPAVLVGAVTIVAAVAAEVRSGT